MMKVKITNNPHGKVTSPFYEGGYPANESRDPSQAESRPVIYRSGKDLVLTNGASLLSNVCIKSGQPVQSIVWTGLRHPFKPETWFSTEKVVIGLDRKNLEHFRIQKAFSVCLFTLGFLMIAAGIAVGLIASIAGLLICFAGIIARTLIPIWSPSSSYNSITVRGCGEEYLKHFPELEK